MQVTTRSGCLGRPRSDAVGAVDWRVRGAYRRRIMRVPRSIVNEERSRFAADRTQVCGGIPDRGRSMDPRRGADGSPHRCSTRRIWDVDPAAVALVTAVLLRREDVESLLDRIGHRDHVGAREEVLRVRLLLGCTSPCALAEAVEHVIDRRTQTSRATVERCPMIQIAGWWSRERDRSTGEELAGLLWRLACDPRPHLEHLVSRVGGHLCVRAMQLLREQRGALRGRAGDALAPEVSVSKGRCRATAPACVDSHPAGIV